MDELQSQTCIIIFAKRPEAGKVKTRLIPALGAKQACELAERMLKHTIGNVLKAMSLQPNLYMQLCIAPDMQDPFWQPFMVNEKVSLSQQVEGDLGVRMATATQEVMAKGQRAILIGSDCPALNSDKFLNIVKDLGQFDALMHPASDGGYVLLGLSRFSSKIFCDIPWSTQDVAALTLRALEQLNFSVKTLEVMHDIDEPEDFQYLPAYLQ